MQAYVYKNQRDDFTQLPEALRARLGPLRFVLDRALTHGHSLAWQDAATARENLALCGFQLQLPPSKRLDPTPQDRTTDA